MATFNASRRYSCGYHCICLKPFSYPLTRNMTGAYPELLQWTSYPTMTAQIVSGQYIGHCLINCCLSKRRPAAELLWGFNPFVNSRPHIKYIPIQFRPIRQSISRTGHNTENTWNLNLLKSEYCVHFSAGFSLQCPSIAARFIQDSQRIQ